MNLALRYVGAMFIVIIYGWFAGLTAQDEALHCALAIEQRIEELAERMLAAFVQIGGGSGVVISPDGYVITNHHVAGRLRQWKVVMSTAQGPVIRQARVVGTDPRGDVCLLKLQGVQQIPYLPMGDSENVKPGQIVLAMGNPYFYGKYCTPALSLGEVSAVHRYQEGYSDCIQHDAALNPGNSGGPLVNLQGELIGINGRIAVRFISRKHTGVGFAIPINQIKLFLPLLKLGGIVYHGLVPGLKITETATPGQGVRVTAVEPSSPAYQAGLQPGDLIVAIDNQPIFNRNRYLGVIGIYPAGTVLPFKIQRNQQYQVLSVTLARRTGRHEWPARPDMPYLGIRISQTHRGPGVEVENVVPNTGAERAGLLPGDIITHFQGIAVRNARHLSHLLARCRIGQKVVLRVMRDEERLHFSVVLSQRPHKR